MKLTAAQRKFAEENHNLIYWFLQRKGLSEEDWYGIVAIGYVNAVASFDPEKAKFTTYAFSCMNNAVRMEKRKKAIEPVVSLNYIMFSEDGSQAELQDLIPDTRIENTEGVIDLSASINRLSGHERKIMIMRANDLTQQEISDSRSLSQPYVSRLLKKVKQELLMCTGG